MQLNSSFLYKYSDWYEGIGATYLFNFISDYNIIIVNYESDYVKLLHCESDNFTLVNCVLDNNL